MKRSLLPLVLGISLTGLPLAFAQSPPGTPEIPQTPGRVLPPERPGNIPGPVPPGTAPGAPTAPSRAASDTAAAPEPDPTTEVEFLTMTGKSNRQQLQLAQLAVKRAQNPQVKTLAQSLVQEYTASGKSLTRLNKTLGFKAPNTDEAGPDATYTRLSALSGAAFDSAFLQAVQRSQATDLSRVQAASTFAGTKALKSYLNSTLPAMRTSAGRVDQLSVATGGTAASPTTGPTTTGVVPGTNPPAIPVPSPPPATPGSTSPTVPGNPQPGTQQPGTQQPGTQQPGTQQPGTQQPGTQQPGARQPGTRQPGNAPRPAAPPARPGSGSGGAPAPAPPAR